MASHLFQNTIIPIQVTLLGITLIAHMAYHYYNPYSANLAGRASLSTGPSQSFSKADVLTIAVKVLGMLPHTNPLSLN